jgi:nucleoid-associated protein YgaU
MAHAYPPKPHRGGRRVAFALMIVVILGFVGGIILRSAPTGTTVHPRVAHSAVHSPVKAPKVIPAPHRPVQAPAPHKASTAPHKSNTHRTYTVRNGDSLWSIAAHVYHNPMEWHKLYELNHSLIGGNPNLIHTGTTLQLE